MDNYTQIQNRKSRKRVLIVSAVLLAIIIVLIGGFLLVRKDANSASIPAFVGIKEARVLSKDDVCLANNASKKAEVQSQKGLSEDGGFWTSYIYDVPAGVNVDVNIADYNGSNTVTGSLVYSDGYGSYNFTGTKQGESWAYTQFAGCE